MDVQLRHEKIAELRTKRRRAKIGNEGAETKGRHEDDEDQTEDSI